MRYEQALISEENGFILITCLGALSLMAVLLAGTVRVAAQDIHALRRETAGLKAEKQFLKFIYSVQGDLFDGQEVRLPDDLEGLMSYEIRDETVKLNPNIHPEGFFLALMQSFEDENGPFELKPAQIAAKIMASRSGRKLGSLEELELLNADIKADLLKLKPYLTVDTEFRQMNIHHLNGIMLKSLIETISADRFVKDELMQKIEQDRESWSDDDLEPREMLKRLRLPETVTHLQAVHQLALLLMTRSAVYEVSMHTKEGFHARTVLRQRGVDVPLEIMRWREW